MDIHSMVALALREYPTKSEAESAVADCVAGADPEYRRLDAAACGMSDLFRGAAFARDGRAMDELRGKVSHRWRKVYEDTLAQLRRPS